MGRGGAGELAGVTVGQRMLLNRMLAALITGSHVLIEGVLGLRPRDLLSGGPSSPGGRRPPLPGAEQVLSETPRQRSGPQGVTRTAAVEKDW